MLPKYSILTTIVFFLIFLFWPLSIANASDYFFQEEFNLERLNNTLDPTKWTVFPNNFSSFTTIKETGGNLVTTQQLNKPQYPLIIAKNALPDGDFTAEIKFQYTNFTLWGTGITLSDQPPINGAAYQALINIDAWQDTNVGFNMRVEYNGQVVKTIAPNTNPHIFKVERTGQKYLLYLDDTLVYTSPDIALQTKYIWMGNPSFQSPFIPLWTSFNVDYIRVTEPIKKTPLIFIPGIGGSELKVAEDTNWSKDDGHNGIFTHNYLKDEKVWVNEGEIRNLGDDDYFDILKFKADGLNSEANLELTETLTTSAYKTTIDFFTNNGYVLNQNFFIFPYDWRKDVSSIKFLLDQRIESIKQLTNQDKVDIVAHSMGGLVIKNYISDNTKSSQIRKLITLGTPYLGSTKFLKALHYGDCLKFEIGPSCLSLNEKELKDILQNMISGYELAPSKKYFDFYSGDNDSHPVPFRDERDIDQNNVTGDLNYLQTKQLLTNLNHNTLLFTPAENFHLLDNNLANTNGVDTYIIAGSGIPTLGQIIEKYSVNFGGIKLPKKDEIKINGDDTVPLFSASLDDPSKNLSLKGSAKLFYSKQTHGELVLNGPTLNLIKNILNEDPSLPSGISTTPFPLEGTQLSVHSPVNVHAYDSNGNHTGPLPDGSFETNIPGSTYDTLDDAKFIFLPNEGTYSIKFEATDQGSFDFKVRDYLNDTNSKTTLFKDIPLTQETKAQTTLDTTSDTPPVLDLDQNGDNTIDSEINPTSILTGDQNYDQIPPKTNIKLIGDKGNNNWYKSNVSVELDAQDESSGISKTEYTLDNGQTLHIYTQPFTISQEETTKLKVKSTDKAGNEELPQEEDIKIDKSPPNLTLNTNPKILWPPEGKLVDVLVSGSSSDPHLKSTNFVIEDEYNEIQTELSSFNQVIKLPASRKSDDKDGRIYRIKAISEDEAGNLNTAESDILVPHDQNKNN